MLEFECYICSNRNTFFIIPSWMVFYWKNSNVINAFTVTFDHFYALLLNKSNLLHVFLKNSFFLE